MRVKRLSITNILGIEHVDIEPGSVTEISGANATGKTSIIEALKAGLGGGAHDATLLRQGAAEGQIVLVLEDGVEITKTIRSDESPVTVTHPTFGKISKTATYIKKLVDALSLNPIEFLTAKRDQRVDYLLKAVPMQVTAEQLAFVPMTALNGISLDGHALEVIGKVARSIYDLRTGVNRLEKEKRATAKQMTETLPADAPEGDWTETLRSTTEDLKKLQLDTQDRVNGIEADARSAEQAQKDLFQARKEALDKELQIAIQKLEADTQIEIARCEKDRDAAIATIAASKKESLNSINADYQPKLKALSESRGQAIAMVQQHAKAEKTREFIAQLTADANTYETESSKLTHALSRLEILKASLLEKLPIEGLEIRDGDLFVGGVPFDRVNASYKIRIAIEIAKLKAGTLPLIACDGLEALDAKTFELFKKEAAKSNLQFVVSRVSEGPLSITTEGQEVA